MSRPKVKARGEGSRGVARASSRRARFLRQDIGHGDGGCEPIIADIERRNQRDDQCDYNECDITADPVHAC